MHRTFLKIILPVFVLLLGSLGAQASSPAPAPDGFGFNAALFALLALVAVLVLANGLLAYVLKQLAFACRDQYRKKRKAGISLKTLLLGIALLVPAANALAQDAAAAVEEAPVSPFISGIPRGDFYFLMGILGFLVLVMLILILLIQMLTKVLRDVPEKAHVPSLIFQKNLLDVFNKSVALDKEATIVMDHEYDGIRELDNALPPWWKYGFVLTIIVSFLYLGYYHAAGGPNQVDEYNAAVAKGEEEKAAYLAKSANNVDENTVTMVLNTGELATAEGVFVNTCAACHAKDGGGGVGPNLTDNHWLHGGDIKDVFKSIKYGWPDKGMKSWKDDYSPKQIAALSSYVKSLKGTKPLVAKPAQGTLYVEAGEQSKERVERPSAISVQSTDKKDVLIDSAARK